MLLVLDLRINWFSVGNYVAQRDADFLLLIGSHCSYCKLNYGNVNQFYKMKDEPLISRPTQFLLIATITKDLLRL